MAEEKLLESIKYYTSELKEKHAQIASDTFDALVKESGIDIDANRVECDNLKNEEIRANSVDSKCKAAKVFAILLIVAALIVVAYIYYQYKNRWDLNDSFDFKPYIYHIIGAISSIALSIFLFTRVKKLGKILQNLLEKVASIRKKCYSQMDALNRLIDYKPFFEIPAKTMPCLELNPYTSSKFVSSFFQGVCEDSILDYVRSSIYGTTSLLSGIVDGQMFLYMGYKKFYWGTKTYYGHLTITWTEWTTDSQGHRVAVHRSQVLTAVLVKPYPEYLNDHCSFYYCKSAEKLNFMRKSLNLISKSEKSVSHLVKKQTKEFSKMEKKALASGEGGTFTSLGDAEFESLFNCKDRDNDVEFRMLFTPYCIKNYKELLLSKEAFGDSFTYIKQGRLNYCDLDGLQENSARPEPQLVRSYSYDIIRSRFMNTATSFFRELYFILAPFFTIPLYQRTDDVKPESFKDSVPSDMQDVESIAYGFEDSVFRPSETVTDIIFKAPKVEVAGNIGGLVVQKAVVWATSFYAVPRMEFVPTFGGDGRMHNVPVHWNEYFEKSAEKQMYFAFIGAKEKDVLAILNAQNLQGIAYTYKDGYFAIASTSSNALSPQVASNIFQALSVLVVQKQEGNNTNTAERVLNNVLHRARQGRL